MFSFSTQSLAAGQAWQTRLARVPRWQIVLVVAVMLPLAALVLAMVLGVLLVRKFVQTVFGGIELLTGGTRRKLHKPADDGRRNVRVMVHSARVLDE